MSKLYKITNLIDSSVVIEDINVKLLGKGCFQLVNEESICYSKNLKEVRRFIKIEEIKNNRIIPAWPFSQTKVETVESEVPKSESNLANQEVITHLGRIEKLLSTIAEQNYLAKPIINISNPSSQSDSKPDSSHRFSDSNPMFIPSKIVPTTKDSVLNVTSEEVEKDDFEKNVKLLSKQRRNQ